jgi:mycofactocin precursor
MTGDEQGDAVRTATIVEEVGHTVTDPGSPEQLPDELVEADLLVEDVSIDGNVRRLPGR